MSIKMLIPVIEIVTSVVSVVWARIDFSVIPFYIVFGGLSICGILAFVGLIRGE